MKGRVAVLKESFWSVMPAMSEKYLRKHIKIKDF